MSAVKGHADRQSVSFFAATQAVDKSRYLRMFVQLCALCSDRVVAVFQ